MTLAPFSKKRRSTYSQVIYGLSHYVKNKKSTERRLVEIRKLRSSLNVRGLHPTREELKKMVEETRP
jgi:hypothetical protein